MASQFEEVTRIRSRVGRILTPKDLSGEIFDKMNLLQEVGLLQHVAGNAHTKAFIQTDGYFYFFEDDFGLRVKSNDPSKKEIRLPCIFLTRVGREISSILPKSDEVQFLRAAADYFADKSESISLMKIISRDGDQSVLLQLHETIK